MDERLREAHTCVCLAARRRARQLTRRYDAALRPHGMTVGQFSLLVTLDYIEPAGMSTLAQATDIERTTLTRNLRHLLDRGWVAFVEHSDRRFRATELTSAGRIAVLAALPAWRTAQEETLSANSTST